MSQNYDNLLNLPNKTIWKFKNLNNDNKYKIIVIFIFCLYVFFKINFSYNFVISISLSFGIIYIILLQKYNQQNIESEYENKKISNMNIFNYKYLFLDVNIINSYYNLQSIKKYNLTEFNKSLKYMDKFLKNYFDLKKKMKQNLSSTGKKPEIYYEKIDNCQIYIKKSMNALMSMVLNVPINMENNGIPMSKIIEINTKKIFYLSNKHLMEIIKLYNLRWSNIKNINIYQHHIDVNSPQPNPLKSYGYMSNYDLY